ncbi:hypothetical protein KR032_000178 [Drosophila birchii]|nr:hypothetical protein KR032_000178 [Drosophila birchii]
MDLRSSQSNHSLGSERRARGRSVRQMEEEISRLMKDNFNLRMRNYFLEEARRRSDPTFQWQVDAKRTQLEEELRDTRRDLQVMCLHNDTLKKKFSRLFEAEAENRRLTTNLSEKDNILKDAALVISDCQDEKFKTDIFVDGIRKLLKVYDESQ